MEHDTEMTYYFIFDQILASSRLDYINLIFTIDHSNLNIELFHLNLVIEYYNIMIYDHQFQSQLLYS